MSLCKCIDCSVYLFVPGRLGRCEDCLEKLLSKNDKIGKLWRGEMPEEYYGEMEVIIDKGG